MPGTFEDEVRAEMEALQKHVRQREARERRERRSRDAKVLDPPVIDVSNLDLAQIRVLISQRFETARLRNQLAAAERRIAELEQAIGRT